MLEKEYILTEREVYKKASPGVYDLYFGKSAKNQIKDNINPIILKAEEKKYQNLIYKDKEIMVFGLIDPTLVYRVNLNIRLEFKEIVSRMFVSTLYNYKELDKNQEKRCIFLKLDTKDDFINDLYCVYPFGNTWITDKKICSGSMTLGLDSFEWLEALSDDEIAINAISEYFPLSEFDKYAIYNEENEKLMSSENISTYWKKHYHMHMALDIYDNYASYFKISGKNIKLYDKLKYFKLITGKRNTINTLINWYILNILIPKYKNDPKFINMIKKSPFIRSWEEMIDYE